MKTNTIPKTVRIEQNGRIKESMSFSSVKYNELVNQEWQTFDLRESLESKNCFWINNSYLEELLREFI